MMGMKMSGNPTPSAMRVRAKNQKSRSPYTTVSWYIEMAQKIAPVVAVQNRYGVGFGRVVQFAGALVTRMFGPSRPRLALAAGVLAFAVLSLVTVHWAAPRFKNFGKLDKALRYQAELRFDLRDALAKAGGASAFKVCGKATAGKFSVPLAAWYLHEHTLDVGLAPAPQGIVIAARTTNKQSLKPQPEQPYPPGYSAVQTVRTTTLFSTCPRPAPGA